MTSTDVPQMTDLDAWNAKLDRLGSSPSPDIPATVHDQEAELAVELARGALQAARVKARRDLRTAGDEAPSAEAVEEHPDVVTATEALAEAEAAAKDLAVDFVFRKLPPHVYDQLQFQHPPTDDQAAKDMVYNPDTYVPALISACSVMPITAERVAALMQPHPETGNIALNQGDVGVLFAACRKVNETSRVTLGKGSRLTRS